MPWETGSLTVMNTTGTVRVACCNASAAAELRKTL